MKLFFISLAPVIVISIYIYIRDKYDKEPFSILVSALLVGALITIPIIYVENWIEQFGPLFSNSLSKAAYRAFAVASFTEELFKMTALFLLIWNNRNFNEKFDGIVYAVFISLGFAGIENLMYVFNHGYEVGIARAFTAVPAHALFGVAMGYYFGLARFYSVRRTRYLVFAFLLPFVLHGIYDFILMSDYNYYLFIFFPFICLLFYLGLKQMKSLSEQSIYRDDGIGPQDSNFLGL
ncbi:MAG: PrsW family intramembrane metalloprotease [Bacteroidales bacterium]|nr:PrsW family intramembrane metalloprotease [Bacteroidales bacterium]MCF8454694.1 PrsW family intramembrane metalloprotease [Bacteroidales bacterium]